MALIPVKVGSIIGQSGERDVVVMCKPGEEEQYRSLFNDAFENQRDAHIEYIDKIEKLLNRNENGKD